jgi:tRNA A-37 threonylcarbamoyl transferase component Bud32
MKKLINQPEFREWIDLSLERQENVHTVSNQGTILHYQQGGNDLIVKTAMGKGLLRTIRERTLQREFHAYQRMQGLPGVPACHGMVAGRYLVIEFIRGKPYREASWSDRGLWFEKFHALLNSIHERGVSHGDLKSKSNIMVTDDEQPCVIDFGTTFVNKPGFHPVNNWLFRHAAQMDINAWVKHKYHGRYENVTDEDMALLNYSRIEYFARIFNRRPTGTIPRKK